MNQLSSPAKAGTGGWEVIIRFADTDIARTTRAHWILEMSHPPTYYIPQSNIRIDLISPWAGLSLCEFKVRASYWSINIGGNLSSNAAWSCADPGRACGAIADDLSFYAHKVDECRVGGINVVAQDGSFYGGWITPNLIGPFKGEPGTLDW